MKNHTTNKTRFIALGLVLTTGTSFSQIPRVPPPNVFQNSPAATPPSTPVAETAPVLTPTLPLSTPTPTPETSAHESAPPKTSKKGKKEVVNYGLFQSDERGLVHLDFVNVEIADLIKAISELTKKNFVYDETVRGKITLVSPKPVTAGEAYRAFLSALEVKDFAVLKVGNLYKIVPTREMKQQPIKTDISDSGAMDEFITRLAPVKHISAAEIVKSLRSMISPNGDMIAYGPTNTLIITDNLGNINRILKIISKLDQAGFKESIEIIKLKYAPASDMAEKIARIFDLSASATSAQPRPAANPGEERAQLISKIIPDERTNSLIAMANEEGLRKLKDVVKQIDQAVIDAGGKGKIHVHALQYADATELASTLSGVAASKNTQKKAARSSGSVFPTQNQPQPTPPPSVAPAGGGGNLLGDQVKVMADPYTNSLIVTASPADYESLLPVINRLDVRRPQAFVEAMILEVDIDKASELGVAGNGAGSIGNSKVFGATTFGSNSSIFLPSSGAALQGLAFGVQGPTVAIPLAGGQSLSIPIYGGFFKTLQSNGTINILSTPSILTQDNTEAEIVVGRVIPFITAQGRDINNQPINQVERQDVALTLRLTPQINVSDELTLNIFQESQDVVASANADTLGPTTSRRSAQTTVLVKDGQTVTIGGLINDTEEVNESKVPILGDIPILGWLFKSKSKRKRKTSLVIFVTPHIIRYPEDLEKVSLRKEDERQRFLENNRVIEQPAVQRMNIKNRIKLPEKTKDVTPANSPTGAFLTPTEAPPVNLEIVSPAANPSVQVAPDVTIESPAENP